VCAALAAKEAGVDAIVIEARCGAGRIDGTSAGLIPRRERDFNAPGDRR
jgi:hypothetical protein